MAMATLDGIFLHGGATGQLCSVFSGLMALRFEVWTTEKHTLCEHLRVPHTRRQRHVRLHTTPPPPPPPPPHTHTHTQANTQRRTDAQIAVVLFCHAKQMCM